MLSYPFDDTKVINKHHGIPYDIYIGRGSKWGNPFSHMNGTLAKFKTETREEAIDEYRKWINNQPRLISDVKELKGKTLGCFCKPKSCHGDILIEILNSQEKHSL